jgi:serine/threonine-protein kinase
VGVTGLALPSGTVLGGRYRLVSLLGKGGFGAVYEGVQEGLGRRVAIKVLHPELQHEEELVARFRREAQAAAALGHPNIVQVTDFVAAPGEPPAIVMELLQGQSFARLIETHGALSEKRVAFIAAQVLSALEAAHAAGIVHRDVKPDNVFLTTIAGVDDIVKVLDFGIAKLAAGHGPSHLTSTGVVMGTPQYMAPEQARGKSVDARADLYALGTCMYQALTGQLPFAGGSFNALLFAIAEDPPRSVHDLRSGIDTRFSAVIERAMAKRPEDRFQSASEMRAALSPWLDRPVAVVTPAGITGRSIVPTAATVRSEIPPPARVPELGAGPGPTKPRSRTPLIVAAAALLLVLGGGTGAFLASRGGRPSTAGPAAAGPAPASASTQAGSTTGSSTGSTNAAMTGAPTPAQSAGSAQASAIAAAPATAASANAPPGTSTVSAPRGTGASTGATLATATAAATAKRSSARMGGRKASLSGMSTNNVYEIETVRTGFAAIAGTIDGCYAATEYEPPLHQFMDYSFTVDAGGTVTAVGVVGTGERCLALDACMNQAIRSVQLGTPTKPGTVNVFFAARLPGE